MSNHILIQEQINESISTKKKLLEHSDSIQNAGLSLAKSLKDGNRIYICGNGGSSCDASHIAAELVVRYKSKNNRAGLPAVCLSSDSAVLTACGNDYGYEKIFQRQIEAFGRKGDSLLCLSTSGNSQNVIKAIEEAKIRGLNIVCLLGGNGGKMKGQSNFEIIVPSLETARIQESHILIGHIFCSIIEKELFGLS